MPIESLTKKDLEAKVPSNAVHQEYFEFLQSARVGSGGRLIVKAEGVGRQTVKNRLKKASALSGKNIKFLRCPTDQVVFQVVE